MPFPLAHPAAILPLKRFCPRYLSLAGLIVGSIVPDVGYAFGLGMLSHSFIGSFEFSLPVGVIVLALIYLFRRPVVEWLPERQRRVFLPLCPPSVPNLLVVAVSILIGAWTHLLWDSFTHQHGWLVRHIPVLQRQIIQRPYHPVLLCDVVWYACSFIGVAWLFLVYQQWYQTADPIAPPASPKPRLRYALLVGLLVTPIEFLHLRHQSALGSVLVGVCSLMLVVIVAIIPQTQSAARSPKET